MPRPVKWEIENDEVLLRADRTSAMNALDPQGRELIMRCGAALEHLVLTIRAFKFAALVKVLNDSQQMDLLAGVRLSGTREPTEDDKFLFASLRKGTPTEVVFKERALPKELLAAVQTEATPFVASLFFAVHHEKQQTLKQLIKRSEII